MILPTGKKHMAKSNEPSTLRCGTFEEHLTDGDQTAQCRRRRTVTGLSGMAVITVAELN